MSFHILSHTGSSLGRLLPLLLHDMQSGVILGAAYRLVEHGQRAPQQTLSLCFCESYGVQYVVCSSCGMQYVVCSSCGMWKL